MNKKEVISLSRGKHYPSERRFFKDPVTGVNITQLSSFPTVNMKFYFHVNAFTPDSKSVVFYSYRTAQRDAQIDVFKVDVDGMNLIQLTDTPGMSGSVLSNDGQWLYYLVAGELRRVSLATYDEEVVNRIDGIGAGGGLGCLTLDDQQYFAEVVLENGNMGIVRFRTDGSLAKLIYERDRLSHVQCEPSEGNVVAFQHEPDELQRNISLIDADGGNLRTLDIQHGNGHWMWVGSTKEIMSNLSGARQGIVVMKEGDAEEELIADGEHFWHGSSSLDGEWMVSDTNWPDHGIQLIHRRTKKYKTLCYSNSSSGHSQWTHPHPSFSPDGNYVVYNSDVGGIPHVYIATIPQELKDELSQ